LANCVQINIFFVENSLQMHHGLTYIMTIQIACAGGALVLIKVDMSKKNTKKIAYKYRIHNFA